MLVLFALALQAAAPPPDIHIGATLQARSVTIEKKGEARLEVWASPDAGSSVEVEAPSADGSRTLRNVRVTVDAQARIGSGLSADIETETGEPR